MKIVLLKIENSQHMNLEKGIIRDRKFTTYEVSWKLTLLFVQHSYKLLESIYTILKQKELEKKKDCKQNMYLSRGILKKVWDTYVYMLTFYWFRVLKKLFRY